MGISSDIGLLIAGYVGLRCIEVLCGPPGRYSSSAPPKFAAFTLLLIDALAILYSLVLSRV